MKKKEKDSLRSLEVNELQKKVKEAQDAMIKLHVERATTQVKNTRQGRKLRLTIAMVQTVIRGKELAHE